MRLYETVYVNDDGKVRIVYDGTQANAAKQRKELKTIGMTDILTEEIDVPTDKAGLMAFLNKRRVA